MWRTDRRQQSGLDGANELQHDMKPPPVPMPDPLDPSARPPMDRFCDLVLKGGVVDGVVYPAAILELARQYRFKGIAGTSVGAIAAAITAAAEYSRRFGSDDGFNEVLRKIPHELARVDEGCQGQTRLRRLFFPDPAVKRLFECFVETFSVKGNKQVSKMFGQIFSRYRPELFVGFLVGLIFGELHALLSGWLYPSVWNCYLSLCSWAELTSALASNNTGLVSILVTGLLGGILGGLLGALGNLSLTLCRELRELAKPGFGFCSGMPNGEGTAESMTEWVHKGIQGAAKLPMGRPLTFNDLWTAPGGPKQADGRNADKSIDLRMISTSVSHGRPYEFPAEDRSVPLFFKLSELRPYFPESVIAYLAQYAPPYTEKDADYYYSADPNKSACLETQRVRRNNPYPPDCGEPYRQLPIGNLPVIVAVRLSMNFPILFKSIPLYSIDRESGPVTIADQKTPDRSAGVAPLPAQKFKTNWFSDGGITSNFPIHFFDAALPGWPTFGVFIAEKSRDFKYAKKGPGETAQTPPNTFLPEFHTTGRSEKWFDVDDVDAAHPSKPSDLGKFFNYLKGVGLAAKDWADNANMRMPGVRDRVITIYKNGDTNGGLNLNLQSDNILYLGYVAGQEAGQKLVHKFILDTEKQNPSQIGTNGWMDHRWVRLNTYILALKEHLKGFSQAANAAFETTSITLQIQQAVHCEPLKFREYFEPKLSPAQRDALIAAVKAIQNLETVLGKDRVVQPYVPKPKPELKVKARI